MLSLVNTHAPAVRPLQALKDTVDGHVIEIRCSGGKKNTYDEVRARHSAIPGIICPPELQLSPVIAACHLVNNHVITTLELSSQKELSPTKNVCR